MKIKEIFRATKATKNNEKQQGNKKNRLSKQRFSLIKRI